MPFVLRRFRQVIADVSRNRKENKMKINVMCLLILSVLLLSGCGTVYQSRRNNLLQTATPKDYGPPPPINHQEIAKNIVLKQLKDPESAKFEEWSAPRRDIIQQGFASPVPILVWITSVNVNAKNSYGGYVGFQPYFFAWKNGMLYAFCSQRGSDLVFWEYIQ